MWFFKRFKVRTFEVGLAFRDGEFVGLLEPGQHWFFDPLHKLRVDVVSQREPRLVHDKLDLIVKSGVLRGRATVLDLKDYERALAWVDDRFVAILPGGQYVYWTGQKRLRTEVLDARHVRLEHNEFKTIVVTVG